MKEQLKKIFSLGYEQYKGLSTSKGLEVKQLFVSLQQEIVKMAGRFNMTVEFSNGKGRWAAVPWIRIYYSDISPSAQNGVYIVYLFAASGKSVFLTLAQGTAKTTSEKLQENKKAFYQKINSNSFIFNYGYLSIGDNKNYGESIIFYKEYQANSLPSDQEMNDDLQLLLSIYKESRDIGLISNKIVAGPNVKPVDQKEFVISDFAPNPLFIRYITALLAKPFVILTGNSGAGKTRIAKRFAKYLERKIYGDVTNCLLVPVGADWTDNTKIMGYYNPLANNGAGEYVKTDILKFIELANANPDIPFFLILDEMNLSHVERYFSDFLSKMETPDDPFDIDHYGKVPFPKNLFVTGTVNIDETTYMFSPKVLDRANVIEFIPDKEDVLRIFSQKPEADEIETAPEGVAENFIALARDVRNYSNGPLTDAGANLNIIFGKLYDILKTAGFEFAYRTTKEITLYYCAAHSLDPNVYTYKVIDEQIVQKILPKIHGNKKQIGNLLYKLKDFLETDSEEDEFLLSRAKIQAMIEKLEKFQYASFI